ELLQDVAPSTSGTYADAQTPKVSPAGTPESQMGGSSPFSPLPGGREGLSPFSPQAPGSGGGYSPAGTDFSSPGGDLEYSPASPSYSPAAIDPNANVHYPQFSPTYSPRSVAYTPSGSTLDHRSEMSAGRRAGTSRRDAKHTTTSPAWSPTYSPSSGSAAGAGAGYGAELTSPVYTPMSAAYGAATSPVYTPTSPAQQHTSGVGTSPAAASPGPSPYGAATSPLGAVELGEASPVIQAGFRQTSPGYADVVTSPSYTPQDDAPAAAMDYNQAPMDVVYSEGVTDIGFDDDRQSELFEPSDDEDLTYVAPGERR
ncbi:unnamed protein product, partial [Polarella glacialis]